MSKVNGYPSGWVSSTLSKHIDLLTGFAFKSSEYKEQGIRLLRGDNVMQNNIRWDDAKFWDENSYEELSRYQLKEHDIVIALDRTWVKAGLKVSVIRKRDIPSLLVQRVARLRAKSTLNQSFLSYIVRSHRFEQMAKFSKTETAVPHISPSDIRNFKIELPSLLEQRNIAKILELWDNAIEKTEALIAAKEKQFEWLTSNLINRAGHKRTAASGLMTEVSKRNKNSTIERVLSVTNHSGFVLPEEQFERRVASANVSNYKVVEQGQYAYNPSRINVGSIARLDDWENGILSPMYVVFKLDTKKVCSDYFLHWLNSSEARQRIKNSAQGSVRETVSFKDLGAIDIPLPAMDVQKDVTYKLNLAQKEISLLKNTLEQYRSQKRGLMQKLLTGEWQVGSSQHLSEETYQEASA